MFIVIPVTVRTIAHAQCKDDGQRVSCKPDMHSLAAWFVGFISVPSCFAKVLILHSRIFNGTEAPRPSSHRVVTMHYIT